MTSFSLNVTKHTLESVRSTAPGNHRGHMTNLIVATLLMSQPTLVVVTTSAVTSAGSAAPRLDVDQLAMHAPGLLHWRLRKAVEITKGCAMSTRRTPGACPQPQKQQLLPVGALTISTMEAMA